MCRRNVSGVFSWFFSLLSTLTVVGWVYYLICSRNIFQLSAFSATSFGICLGLTLAGSLGSLIGHLLRSKTKGGRWSWLLAVVFLTLSTVGWGITLGTCWDNWQAAADTGRIALSQLHRLQINGAIGLLSSGGPLIWLLWPEKTQSRDTEETVS